MKDQNIVFTGTIPQMWKARFISSALVLGIVALIMQVSVLSAQGFDLSSLNGNYADSSVTLVPETGQHPLVRITAYAPYTTLVLYTFDGAGGFMARAVFNFSGGVLFGAGWDLNLTGTYTVNADGTGTMTLAGLHRSNFVIGAGGNELKYIGADPDTGIITTDRIVPIEAEGVIHGGLGHDTCFHRQGDVVRGCEVDHVIN